MKDKELNTKDLKVAEKGLNKSTISDLFVHMLETGESETVLEAIRKERGDEKVVKTEAELLKERKNILKQLTIKK